MSKYEIIDLIIQGFIAAGAMVFGVWQIFINRRLAKVQDYIALSIVPGGNGTVRLINTGKINLYIHAFEIDEHVKILDRGCLVSATSLDSSYYWLPTDFIPRESKRFSIKIYLTDEFNKKYLTEGGGESTKIDEEKSKCLVWTYKTGKSDWAIRKIKKLSNGSTRF